MPWDTQTQFLHDLSWPNGPLMLEEGNSRQWASIAGREQAAPAAEQSHLYCHQMSLGNRNYTREWI